MGDPVTQPAETAFETSPELVSAQATGSPKHSTRAARSRTRRKRVKAANRAELSRIQAEQLAETREELAEQHQELPTDAPVATEPPPEPLDPEKVRETVSRYVRAVLCGGNLLAARWMGRLPIEDASDYHATHETVTEELASMCPDALARHKAFRFGAFVLGFVARHLELATGMREGRQPRPPVEGA